VSNPDVLILDALNEGIQPNIVQLIRDVLLKLNQEQGMTIILVELGEKFVLMEKGQVISSGQMTGLTGELVGQYLAE
jgi:urea transport system ATP-binding protein